MIRASQSIMLAVAAALSAALPGCHSVAKLPSVGASSFIFNAPPRPAKTKPLKEAKPFDQLVGPEPIGKLTPPRYPASALAAGAGTATIGVRVTVDASGGVSNVGSSPFAISFPNRFSDEFEAAIGAAVTQWRFQPAEIRHLEPMSQPGEKPYWRLVSREKIEAFLDVTFTFSGSGEVQTQAEIAPARPARN